MTQMFCQHLIFLKKTGEFSVSHTLPVLLILLTVIRKYWLKIDLKIFQKAEFTIKMIS